MPAVVCELGPTTAVVARLGPLAVSLVEAMERHERDIQDRFGEFSAVELWHFLEALEG